MCGAAAGEHACPPCPAGHRGRRMGPGWGSQPLGSVTLRGEATLSPGCREGAEGVPCSAPAAGEGPGAGSTESSCPSRGSGGRTGVSESYRVRGSLLVCCVGGSEREPRAGSRGNKTGTWGGKDREQRKPQTGGRGPEAAETLKTPPVGCDRSGEVRALIPGPAGSLPGQAGPVAACGLPGQ